MTLPMIQRRNHVLTTIYFEFIPECMLLVVALRSKNLIRHIRRFVSYCTKLFELVAEVRIYHWNRKLSIYNRTSAYVLFCWMWISFDLFVCSHSILCPCLSVVLLPRHDFSLLFPILCIIYGWKWMGTNNTINEPTPTKIQYQTQSHRPHIYIQFEWTLINNKIAWSLTKCTCVCVCIHVSMYLPNKKERKKTELVQRPQIKSRLMVSDFDFI